MSTELHASNGYYIDIGTRGWSDILTIAFENGWEPMGTISPYVEEGILEPDDWDGNYCSNDFQLVCEDDALAIAAALERALETKNDNSLEWIKWYVENIRNSGGIVIS